MAIRMVLYYTGVTFNDNRISFEEFQKRKKEGVYLFGSVPVVTIPQGNTSMQLAETSSILRYYAQLNRGKNGERLYPVKDRPDFCFEIDALVEYADEFNVTSTLSML